ncbi:Uncharacterised protein [Chlamydia trachomatis]|nr:Uncharacterised protein [Chlamydia trachomatis]
MVKAEQLISATPLSFLQVTLARVKLLLRIRWALRLMKKWDYLIRKSIHV